MKTNTPKKYVGHWVTLFPQSNPQSTGKLSKITDDGFIVLNPYLALTYKDNKEFWKIITNHKGISIPLSDNITTRSETRKNIEDYCKYQNTIEDSPKESPTIKEPTRKNYLIKRFCNKLFSKKSSIK